MKCGLSLILFFLCAFLYAQEKVVPPAPFQNEKGDTLLSSSADQNKLAADTLTVSDSTKTKKKYDVDAVVFASSSDSLIFDVQKKKMYLYNDGELKYKDTDLKSGKILVDYETNQLEAFGIADTADTAKVKLKQTPKLIEGKDNYEGSHIKYNFKNQSGFISLAKNKEKTQRYEGEKVKKVDKTTYFIEDGMFTTCEKDTPDTYFSASQMKVIQKDEIVARWIFMYVGGVPFPIPLPFAVFPNETGRRSGIIIPTYGKDTNRGQYFKNFGYFWAVSDYFDETLTADYYLKGGYGLHNRIRYAKRYDFSGALTAAYSNLHIGQLGDRDPAYSKSEDYNISWYHNQQIDPTSRLDVNLQFMSSNYYSTNSSSYSDLLSQNIISNATFSKSWSESGSSLNINYSRTQNLSTGNIYETLPNVSFSKSMTYPFKNDDSETSANQKWYELIGYSYTGQFLNNRNKTNGQLDIHGGFKHDISVSASPKIGYFSVSPNVNYTEKWYNKRIKYEKVSYQTVDSKTGNTITADSIRKSTINDLNFVRTFSLGVSASTRMYGIYNPNMLGVESFRHTLTPTISYSYQPNFGNDGWGYFDSYTDLNGKAQRYDKFDGQVFGGVNSYETQQISFGLGNVFEIKMAKSANDTTKEQKKIQLLNFTASMAYNFARDSLKLSDLSLSYRTQVGDLLNFSGSSSYTFYDFNGTTKMNQFLASKGKGLFRLTNFNFSVSTSLTGDKIKSDDSKKDESGEEEKTEKDEGFNAFQKKDYIALYDDSQSPDLAIPWNLNLSYNYNFSKPYASGATSYSNLGLDLGFSLTKNWKFTVRGSYDFQDKKISAPQVTIYRDLHCWEMNFTWNPLGTYSGFHFEIRMKAPEFKDAKITKSGGLYSGKR
jgi:lipopolysaccharide assembly outer membrane protein LptD (OstA)